MKKVRNRLHIYLKYSPTWQPYWDYLTFTAKSMKCSPLLIRREIRTESPEERWRH